MGVTSGDVETGGVELSHVELKADDGEHQNGHKEKQSDLQQGDHSLHDGLEYHLQAWRTQCRWSEMDREKARESREKRGDRVSDVHRGPHTYWESLTPT